MAAFAITGGYATGTFAFTDKNWNTKPFDALVEGAWYQGYKALMNNPIHNQCDPGSDNPKPTPKTKLAQLELVGDCLMCNCAPGNTWDSNTNTCE